MAQSACVGHLDYVPHEPCDHMGYVITFFFLICVKGVFGVRLSAGQFGKAHLEAAGDEMGRQTGAHAAQCGTGVPRTSLHLIGIT